MPGSYFIFIFYFFIEFQVWEPLIIIIAIEVAIIRTQIFKSYLYAKDCSKNFGYVNSKQQLSEDLTVIVLTLKIRKWSRERLENIS